MHLTKNNIYSFNYQFILKKEKCALDNAGMNFRWRLFPCYSPVTLRNHPSVLPSIHPKPQHLLTLFSTKDSSPKEAASVHEPLKSLQVDLNFLIKYARWTDSSINKTIFHLLLETTRKYLDCTVTVSRPEAQFWWIRTSLLVVWVWMHSEWASAC